MDRHAIHFPLLFCHNPRDGKQIYGPVQGPQGLIHIIVFCRDGWPNKRHTNKPPFTGRQPLPSQGLPVSAKKVRDPKTPRLLSIYGTFGLRIFLQRDARPACVNAQGNTADQPHSPDFYSRSICSCALGSRRSGRRVVILSGAKSSWISISSSLSTVHTESSRPFSWQSRTSCSLLF